jgi:hypothetical protein
VATVDRLETKEGKISLSFRFLKSDLKPEAAKKHFGTTHFRVGSSIALPTTLTKAFDMPPSVLKAGLYKISATNTYFEIQATMA